MNNPKPTYPFPYLGYDTFIREPVPVNYCFGTDCPNPPFPLTDTYDPNYKAWYTAKQKEEYNTGLERWLSGRQVKFDDFPYRASPVFNSNPFPLSSNYMNYDFIGPQTWQ